MSERSELTSYRRGPDVLIIGAGLAGLWAAHRLPPGLDVLVLDGGGGASDLAGGGLAGPEAEADGELAELQRVLADTPAALEFTGARPWIMTEHGERRSARLAPRAMVAPDPGPRAAVIRIPGLENHLPERAAERLGRAAGLDRPLPIAAIAEPAFVARSWGHAELAAALDEDEPAARFIEACRRALDGLDAESLLFPPILGLGRHRERVHALEQRSGLAVQELEAAGPAAPGLRLRLALRQRLAGRARLVAARAEGLVIEGGRVIAARFREGPGPLQTCAPHRVILATGRYLGGGLTSGPRIREPLADCAVFSGPRPIDERPVFELFADDPDGRHPALSAGLRLDEAGRPVDADGRPRAENLYACGLIVGGHDPARDRGTAGLVLLAARRAAEAAAR